MKDDYHLDISRIGKSGLDLVNRSPAHYWAEYLDPNRVRKPDTDYQIVGKAFHYAVLEPHKFDAKYFCLNDTAKLEEIGGANPRATKLYKEWKAEIIAANEGKYCLSVEDYDRILRMRDAVHAHPSASVLLQNGEAEKTVFFDEPETGAKCKLRSDWRDYNHNLIVDLKSCEDASPNTFGRHSYNYRYHVQAAFYLDGTNLGDLDFCPDNFVFIAVEKEPPYLVAVYSVDEDTLHLGREAYMEDLRVYQRCVETGIWHGYPHQITRLRMPGYAFKKFNS